MPASKLHLGMTTYGRTFWLKDQKLNNVGDATSGKGGKEEFSNLITLVKGTLKNLCKIIIKLKKIFQVFQSKTKKLIT